MNTHITTHDVLYIFGGHSTALEIADAARASKEGMDIIHVVPASEVTGGSDQVQIDLLQEQVRRHAVDADAGYILSMADVALRTETQEIARQAGLPPVSVIHPDTWVAPSAVVGSGCYIAAGCRISTNARIANHCMLNFNTVFGHDASAEEHFVANPGAVIGGGVQIGKRVLLGANSFILQGVTIADDCRIDAMTYACRDLEEASLCTSRQIKVFPRKDL